MADEEKELDSGEVKNTEKKKKQEKLTAQSEPKEEYDEKETKGGKFLLFLITVVIIAIWLIILAMLIKWDVGGFGSSVLYPIFKDVPYVNQILPEVKDPTVDDPYAFESMEDAVTRIKELELELDVYLDKENATKEEIEALQAEIERLKVFEKEQDNFAKTKEKFYKEVVFGEQSPDIEEYKKYYESIDPKNAALLYKQVVEQVEEDEEIQDYVKAYSTMKPKNAAAILEKMSDDLPLIARILTNMNAEARGSILAAMDSELAAAVTKLMEP